MTGDCSGAAPSPGGRAVSPGGRAAASSPVAWPGLDGAAERRFRLVVLGDVMIEARADLPGVRFADVAADRLAYAPARAVVAGTAVNMARCAAGYFRRVAVLGKIGDDAFTPVIRRELRRMGVRDLLCVEPGAANGVAVMLRDGAEPPARGRGDGRGGPDGRRGVRLLVVDDHGPGRRLTESEVHRAAPAIRRADALFADGYALLAPVSRAALRAAVRIAREAGTLVAFDLVPHDVDRRLPAAEAVPVLEAADVVITEVPTLARLLGLPVPCDASGVRDMLPVLDRMVGGRPLWLLRHGPSSLEDVVAYRREHVLVEYPTGYGPGVRRTGFGDRLAAGELYWWLSLRSSGGVPGRR
ncbi:hypothetical protein Acsp04_11500 [Actinomadura sp. NBRC 104425]|uniref:carbohydrate kinase family protein n=1 Tax=Actinomadura sp. NBRC 104425 TaxID=3032204 RepID=UPI0024A45DA0|nr:hypothetical protein [Actinomadura sp. NBRC 104425]GLZ10915.1 hypothetical protein Acsp04_11500 [Actinomadura sp. NBRC 104425]